MEMSKSEALELLSAWKTESISVLVTFEDTEVFSNLLALVDSVSDDMIVLSAVASRTTIKLCRVKDFDYADMREESQEIRSVYGHLIDQRIVIRFPLGSYVRLYSTRSR
jgi:hypothetical protein